MRIQTLNRDYEILQITESGERMDIMIARDEKHPQEGKCMLLVLKQREDIYKYLPFLARQKENTPFEDFLEYFPRDGYLYLVFRYYEYTRLSERLSADAGFEERLVLAGNILKRLIFLNLQLYFQYEALEEGNLLAGENGEIRFLYQLKEPDRFDDLTANEVSERLHAIFCTIFRQELEQHSCPPIEDFLEKLRTEAFPGLTACLKEFETAAGKAKELKDRGEIKPDGWGFRMWKRIKKLCSVLKYILLIAVLGALIGYLIYTIRYPSYKAEEAVNYRSIGTLTIGETTEADDGGQTGE